MDAKWSEMLHRYELALTAEDEQLQQVMNMMLLSESNVITSMMRNIGYHEDPEFDPGTGEAFNVVFKVVVVVRGNSMLAEQCVADEDFETYYRMMYGAALEVVKIWYAIGILVYEGIDWEDRNMNDPRLQALEPKIHLPNKAGAFSVTVFGDMIDKQGRSNSVTVTDQSNPESVYRSIGYQTWLWDEITAMSHHQDFNKNGSMPYRSTGAGKKTKRKVSKPKTESRKVAQTKPAPTPKKTRKTSDKGIELPKPEGKPPKIKKIKRPTRPSQGNVQMCPTITCVKDVEPNTVFDVRVALVEVGETDAGKKALYFYSFNEGSDGAMVADKSDRIWIMDNYDEFPELMSVIQESVPEFDNGETQIDTSQANVVIRAKKVVSDKKMVAYYRDINIVKWE